MSFLVFLPFLVVGASLWAWIAWRRKSSQTWPRAVATLRSSSVEAQRAKNGHVYRMEASFTYQVSGQQYFGSYQEVFFQRSQAEQLERSFRNLPLYVRHEPGVPASYVVDPYADAVLPEPPQQQVP